MDRVVVQMELWSFGWKCRWSYGWSYGWKCRWSCDSSNRILIATAENKSFEFIHFLKLI